MALTDSLIAYWKLDETSGTRVDSSGNGLDLTDNNTVGNQAGIISNAAFFMSASSEYLSRADEVLLSPTSAFSIQTWVYQASVASNRTFAMKGTFSSSWSWGMQTQDTDEIILYTAPTPTDGGGTAGATTDLNMANSTWYHIVGVYDGSGSGNAGRLKIYANAVSKTLAFAGTIPATIADSTGPFTLGTFGGLGRYMSGRIDEVGFWSRALTSDEVTTLYNGGAGLAYPFAAGGGATGAENRSLVRPERTLNRSLVR